MVTSFRHRIGRRGAALLICGTVEVMYGTSRLVFPVAAPIGTPQPTYFLWVAGGLLAASYAMRRHGDWVGFAALVFPPAAWTCMYALSAALWALSGGEAGYGAGLFIAPVWGGWTALIVLIAGWPEPPKVMTGPDDEPGAENLS